ncbi:unnamed protein product [Microthlaspi erraticum]|uniref:Uncharacterized protein n=1 Tax=Microthlaspi erraticum TaxID=1685480 RepID=A0A6D2IEV5_9BRAS|nr:unnamed protein product [Microthlaspi erraticum]
MIEVMTNELHSFSSKYEIVQEELGKFRKQTILYTQDPSWDLPKTNPQAKPGSNSKTSGSCEPLKREGHPNQTWIGRDGFGSGSFYPNRDIEELTRLSKTPQGQGFVSKFLLRE